MNVCFVGFNLDKRFFSLHFSFVSFMQKYFFITSTAIYNSFSIFFTISYFFLYISQRSCRKKLKVNLTHFNKRHIISNQRMKINYFSFKLTFFSQTIYIFLKCNKRFEIVVFFFFEFIDENFSHVFLFFLILFKILFYLYYRFVV